jgi:hypothetical protein
MSAFMYADDLILISPSILELQRMVDLCCKEFAEIDLKLNNAKSTCMRIGPIDGIENVLIFILKTGQSVGSKKRRIWESQLWLGKSLKFHSIAVKPIFIPVLMPSTVNSVKSTVYLSHSN